MEDAHADSSLVLRVEPQRLRSLSSREEVTMPLCLHGIEACDCDAPCNRCGHSCKEHDERGCDHGVLNCAVDTGQISGCSCAGFVLAKEE